MKEKNKNIGFTLIEVMIVLVIIGVIVAIVMPRMGEMVERQYERQSITRLEMIRNAIAIFFGDNRRFPLWSAAGIVDENGNGITWEWADLVSALQDRYLGGSFPQLNLPRSRTGEHSGIYPTNNGIVVPDGNTPGIAEWNDIPGGAQDNGLWVYWPSLGIIRINCSHPPFESPSNPDPPGSPSSRPEYFDF